MTKASQLLSKLNESEESGPVELMSLGLGPGKQIPSNLWVDRLYFNGFNVFKVAYDQENTSLLDLAANVIQGNDKSFDGQECFLAYSPSRDTFYMAFEGSVELPPYNYVDDDGEDAVADEEWENTSFVVSAKFDKGAWTDVKISDSYSAMFYGGTTSVYESIKRQYGDLILIRLD